MYTDNLKSRDATLMDRKMAQSIAAAVLQDSALIYEVFKIEQQMSRDRELAARLSANETPAVVVDGLSKAQKKNEINPWSNAEMLAKVAAIYMNEPDEQLPPPNLYEYDSDSEEAGVAESSSKVASRAPTSKPARRICVACGDEKDFFEVARAPCDHEYCRSCLESLFAHSMKDETLFLPRCDGQEIPLALVRFFLSSQLAKEFDAMYNELSTKNRTYCFDRSCSTFIPTATTTTSASATNNSDTVQCPKCKKTTCTVCKAPSHSGDCPEDTALLELVETANDAQWQRCFQCNRFVELSTGCNHMTYDSTT